MTRAHPIEAALRAFVDAHERVEGCTCKTCLAHAAAVQALAMPRDDASTVPTAEALGSAATQDPVAEDGRPFLCMAPVGPERTWGAGPVICGQPSTHVLPLCERHATEAPLVPTDEQRRLLRVARAYAEAFPPEQRQAFEALWSEERTP